MRALIGGIEAILFVLAAVMGLGLLLLIIVCIKVAIKK